MVDCVLNGEYRITIPQHRADRPEWYDAHGWEKARMSALCHTIRNIGRGLEHRPTVYYVGAEEGELCAICEMQGAEMVLFEPNPKAWPNIKSIWDANNLTQPLCFEGFVSNETTSPLLPLPSWPVSATGEIVGDHGFKELHLEAKNYLQIKLDDVWARGTRNPPNIITCDVEGSEFEVLRGAEKTLELHKPTLFISVHPEFLALYWNEYSRDLRNWVIAKGYKEELLAWDHEAHFLYTPA